MTDPLFQPLQMGALTARNRILMAPLTRGRATVPGSIPNDLMATYYRQRAGAGLIISEATGISREGLGWPAAPGIWSEAQVEGWKPVTKAVHDEGGLIVLQMWHMGRLVHPDFLDGAAPVSASATCAPGHAHTPTGRKDYEPARALGKPDIARVVEDYRKAAQNAKAAGFDGVQLHGANGYLVDQFLRDGTNRRDDEYGGSPQNRTRFLREVLTALIDVWGADRVGVRLSPNGETQGCDDSDPAAIFGEAARVIEELGVAFLELREPGPGRHVRQHRCAQAISDHSRSLFRTAGVELGLRCPIRPRRYRGGAVRGNCLWPPLYLQPRPAGAHQVRRGMGTEQERAAKLVSAGTRRLYRLPCRHRKDSAETGHWLNRRHGLCETGY